MQTVGSKDRSTQLKCSEKENVLRSFLNEGRVVVSDVFGEVVPDVRTEIGQRAKAMSSAIEASEFEYGSVL